MGNAVASTAKVVHALGGPVDMILGSDIFWAPGLHKAIAATVLALDNCEQDNGGCVDVCFAHAARHGYGPDKAAEIPDGEAAFPMGLQLRQAGFRLVNEVRIGDPEGNCIFHYRRESCK